jgi:hypothetical protein
MTDHGDAPVRSVVEHDHSPDTRMLDLDAVGEGDRVGIDASPYDLGLPEGDTDDDHCRIVGEVYRRAGPYDTATDLWVRTPSGAELHVYPRRGKVDRVDDGERVDRGSGEVYGVTTLVNAGLTYEGEVDDGYGYVAAADRLRQIAEACDAPDGWHRVDAAAGVGVRWRHDTLPVNLTVSVQNYGDPPMVHGRAGIKYATLAPGDDPDTRGVGITFGENHADQAPERVMAWAFDWMADHPHPVGVLEGDHCRARIGRGGA